MRQAHRNASAERRMYLADRRRTHLTLLIEYALHLMLALLIYYAHPLSVRSTRQLQLEALALGSSCYISGELRDEAASRRQQPNGAVR